MFQRFEKRQKYIGGAQRTRCRYFWSRKVDAWTLAAACAAGPGLSPLSEAMNHAAVAPESRRPRGLTASDRSTMRSEPPTPPPPPPFPPLTPLPSHGRTFQPPDRSYEVGKTERNRRQQACVVGPLLLGMRFPRSDSAG